MTDRALAHTLEPAGGGPSASQPSPNPQLTAFRHSTSPPRRRSTSWTTMQHHSHTLVLPTPEMFTSVAGGAHYAGALSTHDKHVHPANVEKQTRSLSLQAGDPLVEDKYRGVMRDLQELFCGRPTLEIFERRWRRDAHFEDPWTMCTGFQEVVPRFFAISKACTRSERLSTRIVSATFKPNRLIFSQTQEYTLPWFGTKTITSFVIVDLDDDFKIIRLVDQWNGQDPSARWYALWLRKFNAMITRLLIHVPQRPAHGNLS